MLCFNSLQPKPDAISLSFAGGANEKLASRLLESFLLHLKYAKDLIMKCGFSITLQPPSINAS
ncbi:hypothetical protein CsSME_00025537 [Camellia sinensis var. sinensis]